MTNWPLRNELSLAALPNAAYWARRHAEGVLHDWKLGVDGDFVHQVKLVVSEMVTNAAIATTVLTEDEWQRYIERPLSFSYLQLAAIGQVRLRLSSDRSSHVLIEVGDESDEPPVLQAPGTACEQGRGLFLVESLCDGWGWYPTTGMRDIGGSAVPDDTTRKVVWGRLRLCPLP